jgi:hypothetical protein
MLAALPVAAVFAAVMIAPSSAAACPSGGYCTDSEGVYQLVPPFPPTGEFEDCVWEMHIEWGDGKSEALEFEAQKKLSHAYPHFGKYIATVQVSNGHHKNKPAETCPGEKESYSVYWQTAEEIKEEEARVKVEKEAQEKKEAEESAAAEAQRQKEREEREAREQLARERLGANGGGGPGGSSGGGGGQTAPAFWHSCRARVQVHGVGCKKARRVIGHARRRNLLEEGPQEVLGFTCRLTNSLPHRISCRRGKSRVLAPL